MNKNFTQCSLMHCTIYVKYFLAISICIFSSPVEAQIVTDGSLGTEQSTFAPNQDINGFSGDKIDGGAVRGENLFHSFQDFNISEGQSAYFVNPTGVTNIFSRVTGHNPSKLLGKLGVLGNANLFFLNPNGIIFGRGANLDLKGSFFATTANSIKFSDGSEFSAINYQAPPLLTISRPIGLNFAGNSGAIQVQGMGHSIFAPYSLQPTPVLGAGESVTGLKVYPNNIIALVGGEVNLDGGIVTAPEGKIEIGSVDTGILSLNADSPKLDWSLDYSNVQSFKNISLSNLSLLDTSGEDSGIILLRGKDITFSGNSFALIQSQKSIEDSGRIDIKASQSLSIFGGGSNFNINNVSQENVFHAGSGLLGNNLFGRGADIRISAQDVLFENGGVAISSSLFSGTSGEVSIDASNSVRVLGASPINPLFSLSVVATNAAGSSHSGNIAIKTKNLLVQDGGSIVSGTFGTGESAKVFINADKSVVVKGFRIVGPGAATPSAIATSSYGPGNSGNLIVSTPQLEVLAGSSISTSTVASGKAGDVFIDAPSIKISGFLESKGGGTQTLFPTLIASSGLILDPILQQLLNLPAIPSGSAGNVEIKADEITASDLSQIIVKNDGLGEAGTVRIESSFLKLDTGAQVAASTASNQGGNIFLQSRSLQLHNGSNITATAGEFGNGGNIKIDTNLLALTQGSSITANAFRGKGGNIQIATQGLFQSPDSLVTATSKLGINGNVVFNALENNLIDGIVELPQTLLDVTNLIAQGCPGNLRGKSSSFTQTGRGGLADTPYKPLNPEVPIWIGSFLPAEQRLQNQAIKEQGTLPQSNIEYSLKKEPISLVAADTWWLDSEGNVVLASSAAKAQSLPSLNCEAFQNSNK